MYKVFASIIMLLVTSCATIEDIKKFSSKEESKAKIFSRKLANEYRVFAEMTFQESMWGDFKHFKNKSRRAENGEEVLPEDIEKWNIPEAEMNNLAWASGRLANVMIDSVKANYPDRLAHAQMLFDCWVQRSSRAVNPSKIEDCRMDFVLEMSSLENLLMPIATENEDRQPIENSTVYSDNAGIIYFSLDSDEVNADGMQVIEKTLNIIKDKDNYILQINGYTDSSGEDNYNMNLSKNRAKAVAGKFMDRGVDTGNIKQNAYGEEKPIVQTPDDSYQKRNRRVEVNIESSK